MYKTMLSSYLKHKKKNTESINPIVSKTKSGGTMALLKCALCIVKNQDLLKNKKQKDY